jgi:histidine ammonia-lyase
VAVTLQPVTLTGHTLTLDDVVRVARDRGQVKLAPEAIAGMRRSRAVVERALERGDSVYGLTTGVAALKRSRVDPAEIVRFNRDMVLQHRIAQGPPAAPDMVRAACLRLLNYLVSGFPGARPELAEHLAKALNADRLPQVRTLGSVGQSDLAQMADLAHGVLGDFPLAGGEGLALMNNNSFSTGSAALAIADLTRLHQTMHAVGALSLEGFHANPSVLHPIVGTARPLPGLARSLVSLRSLLEGSFLWHQAPRNLQDPLTFRTLPQALGALDHALTYAREQLDRELNAAQGNPIVVTEEDRVISVGNFDVSPMAAALDLVRIGLASFLTGAAERAVKHLERPWSGLPTGLTQRDGLPDAGLNELSIAAVSLAGEARLLAQPVSFETPSSSLAEGIEDRMTFAPLAVRRLNQMLDLGARILAIELTVSGQAVERRGLQPLGRGTAPLLAQLRRRVPFMEEPAQFPQDLQPVVDFIGQLPGKFSRE